MVRIAILWPQTSGFWTAGGIYTENLLKSLALVEHPDFEVVVFEPRGGEFAEKRRGDFPNVEYVDFDEPLSPSLAQRAVAKARRTLGVPHTQMAFAAREARLDVVFGNVDVAVKSFVPWVAWIPDFQHLHYPQFFAKGEVEARDTTYLRWTERCSLMMLSSRDCEKDFRNFAPQFAGKARVVPFVSLFPDDFFDRDASSVAGRLGIRHPYVVVPNQWWRHKNHETAIRAAGIARDSGLELTWVFTGALQDHRDPDHPSRMLQLISELGLTDSVRTLGAMPRVEQVQLLRDCDLIVHPSLFEGWSTVVEDAKTIGQRMVLSDLAIHREQEPPNALFFEPLSPEDLAEKVGAALAGAVERRDERAARDAALVRARTFGEAFAAVCTEAAGGR